MVYSSRSKLFTILLALCLVLTTQSGRTQDGVFEPEAELQVSSLLSPELRNSDLYTIDEVVVNDGLFNHYNVRSVYGEFKVGSTRALRQLLAEQQFAPLGRILSAVTPTGTVVVAIPADHLLWTENVADAATWLVDSTKTATPAAKFELWVLGDFSKKAEAELQGMGWQLYPNAQVTLLPNNANQG
jgi:hypothetical protein